MAAKKKQTPKHTPPFKLFGIITLALSLGGTIALRIGLSWDLLISWLVSVNLVAFLTYGYDKLKAQHGGLRVPENILHALVLTGGCAGGLGGMYLFHHKTSKSSFQQVFWTIIFLEVLVIVAWLLLR